MQHKMCKVVSLEISRPVTALLLLTERISLLTGVTCVSAAAITGVHLLCRPVDKLKDEMLHGAPTVPAAVFHKTVWIHI